MSGAPEPSLAALGQWLVGFVSFLLLPLLGVLALTRRRLAPLLVIALAIWAGLGIAAAYVGPPAALLGSSGTRGFWTRWAVGLFLGAGIAVVAHLREKKRTRRWIELGLAILAASAFARGLWLFLQRYG